MASDPKTILGKKSIRLDPHGNETEELRARLAAVEGELQELRAFRDTYNSFIDNLPVGLVRTELNPNGSIVMANPALAEMFGYDSVEEFINNPSRAFYYDMATRSRFVLESLVASGEGSYEEKLRRKDGSPIWGSIKIRLIRGESGEYEYADGMVEDITERKLAEEATNTILESIPVGMVIVGKDKIVRRVNHVALEMMGLKSADDIVGKICHGKMCPNRGGRCPILDLGKNVDDSETVLVCADGSKMPILKTAVPIRINDEDVLLEAFVDISANKRFEKALQEAHMKLVNAREAERRRLARELHDSFGQNLIALALKLKATARSAENSGADDAKINEAAEHCRGLVGEVRRICHGLFPPTLESLGLIAALEQLTAQFDSSGVEVALRREPEITQARFRDEVEIALFRIAQEAVSNALRHGGAEHVDVELAHEDGLLILTVTDDGKGFDVDAVEGVGLGLNAMAERTRAVGGKLSIASEPGETRVEVAVPASIE